MKPISTAGIILAAGKGTRMKSATPKCLHRVCGVPMAELVGRAMLAAGIARPVVVIGHGGQEIRDALGPRFDYAWQREQLGTGHAVLSARESVGREFDAVVVASGDTPLLSPDLIRELVARHREAGAVCTVATAIVEEPDSYGRILRDGGRAVAIVEARDAATEILEIREINAGLYCFDASALFALLPKLEAANAQGEYYLTDAVRALSEAGGTIETMNLENPELLAGVNDRWQLATAERELRMRFLRSLAESGVTIRDPETTHVCVDATVGPNTVIEPGTVIEGKTSIGSGCKIGPFTRIQDAIVGDEATISMSQVVRAVVERGAKVGPFANLRPGAQIGARAKIGNFVEVKNSTIGEDASAAHLTYIGDSAVGARANIGAGTITCNYDGIAKHRTEIGEGAFVGSNSTLVAPVSVGENAFVAAGSVVTHNVPADSLAIARARQEVKEEWAAHWRKRKRAETV